MKSKESLAMDRTDEEDLVEITYYTDPLCCWSWAFEPQWRRLRYEYSGKIKWRYRMGGLLPDWSSFSDPMNDVSRPIQMGPLWLEAKYISGMPIKDTIWIHDPPTSSYPACIAVKCAALQSPEAAENYLRRLREAVMLEAKNISKEEVLLEVANSLARDKPHLFDAEAFEEKLHREEGREAFREDLQQVRYNSISRFPTLTLQKPQQPGVMIVGYRPYDVLLQALEQIAPDLQPTQLAVDAEVYADYWGHTNEREVREALTYVNT